MRERENAIRFRADIIRGLAEKRPDLRNESGEGFWPIPVMIPVVLAKCIYKIDEERLNQTQAGNYETAAMLTEVRTRLTHLVAEGDLGEDHAGIYMEEHPNVKNIDMKSAPFFKAYQTILKEEDPFKLLGFVYSVEAGSLEAVKALVASRMIAKKRFAELHMIEEVEHDRLAEEIKTLVLKSEYATRFAEGCDLHDSLYEKMVTGIK